MQTYTDVNIDTCPWSAFRDPFVRRVLGGLRFMESGQLAFAHPEPSNRFVEGIEFYLAVDNRVHSKLLELEREKRERESASHAAAAPKGRRG